MICLAKIFSFFNFLSFLSNSLSPVNHIFDLWLLIIIEATCENLERDIVKEGNFSGLLRPPTYESEKHFKESLFVGCCWDQR